MYSFILQGFSYFALQLFFHTGKDVGNGEFRSDFIGECSRLGAAVRLVNRARFQYAGERSWVNPWFPLSSLCANGGNIILNLPEFRSRAKNNLHLSGIL